MICPDMGEVDAEPAFKTEKEFEETGAVRLLQAIFGEDSRDLVDYPYLKPNSPYDEYIKGVFGTMGNREIRILELRFGLDNGQPRTLERVGKEFNLSRDRIRQIEAKALRKLRHPSKSRQLKKLLYEPTRDDKRAVAMRDRLWSELQGMFPLKVVSDIVLGIKRPYVKRALRDLQLGNIAEVVRHSCGLAIKHCKVCGTVTLPNWDFCSKECERRYKIISLVCDYCGKIFERKASLTIWRLKRWNHYYCSKTCSGKALGHHQRGRESLTVF